jgi:hypothetical protein
MQRTPDGAAVALRPGVVVSPDISLKTTKPRGSGLAREFFGSDEKKSKSRGQGRSHRVCQNL